MLQFTVIRSRWTYVQGRRTCMDMPAVAEGISRTHRGLRISRTVRTFIDKDWQRLETTIVFTVGGQSAQRETA